MDNTKLLLKMFDRLLKSFGRQYWWPGESDFEVVVGAILTQNTNWGNVEKAIRNLKDVKCLTPGKLYEIDERTLAELIRPSGYFNVKARRLKNFIEWLFLHHCGSLSKMFLQDFALLRTQLLSVNGIGKETADSILLYAVKQPVFVVDAYTKRVLVRHGLIPDEFEYEDIRAFFEDHLPRDVALYNEFHALLVRVGNNYCKPRMKCEECPLKTFTFKSQ